MWAVFADREECTVKRFSLLLLAGVFAVGALAMAGPRLSAADEYPGMDFSEMSGDAAATGGAEASGHSDTFRDVPPGHWAASAIRTAVEKGYVSGYPDGTFRPSQPVTRAEFMRMLVDALQLPHSQGGSPWFQPYAAALLEVGILEESDFSDFQKPISRLEIMRLVSRSLSREDRYRGYIEAFSGLYNGDLPFTDYRDIQDADLPLVALAYGAGIVNGYHDDATIRLDRTATRAESVTMIENFLKARVTNPETVLRLQELKEVAETGTNAAAVSNLMLDEDLGGRIDPEKIVTEHPRYTARLKRLYVLPLEGEKTSIYERKFLWDRSFMPEHWSELHMMGLVAAVLDVIPKKDFDLNITSFDTYLMPSGNFWGDEPATYYGYKKMNMYDQDYRKVKKGQTYEVVIGGYYSRVVRYVLDTDLFIQTNNAISGHGLRLLKNPDAVIQR